MVVFIFSVLDWKYTLGENLVQKIKIVSLELNRDVHFFRFRPEYYFQENLVQKIEIVSLS